MKSRSTSWCCCVAAKYSPVLEHNNTFGIDVTETADGSEIQGTLHSRSL